MASWKKVIVSGSNAVLAQVTASGGFSGDGSGLTGITATSVDIDGLSALGGTGVAQGDHFIFSDGGTEKKITFSNLEDAIFANVTSGGGDVTIAAGGAASIAADAVTNAKLANITRGSVKVGGTSNAPTDLDAKGDGKILVGDGTDVNSVSISGDITLANDGTVAIAANAVALATDTTGDFVSRLTAGTGLTSTGATSGENIAHSLSVDAAQTQITSVGTLGGGAISSGFGNIDNGTSGITGSMSGSFEGNFSGDGSGLTGVTGEVNIDALGDTGVSNSSVDDADEFIFSDGGTEKKISYAELYGNVFGEVSGDATVAVGGALTIAANAVEGSMLNSNVAGTGLTYAGSNLDVDLSGESAVTIGASTSEVTIGDNLTVTGDLLVSGDTVQQQVSNLNVEDKFVLFNSGSTSGDGGIVVQTGASGVGTALAYDDSAARWGISEADGTAWNATSIDTKQYVVSVSGSGADPSGNPLDFGADAATRAGMMHVNTTSGDIFIYS